MTADTHTEANKNGEMKAITIKTLLFFLIVLGIRLYVCVPLMEKTDVQSMFRIGPIPWSDARGWVEGGKAILSGQELVGFSARRPIYPLFLANLFLIFGQNFKAIIIFQTLLLCLSLSFSYYLLRDIKPRIFAILFLSFLASWRLPVSTELMSENLGVFFLIITFSFLFVGFMHENRVKLISGYFFMGLSQAVRPWAIFSLATLPMAAFFMGKEVKEKLRIFVFLLTAVSLGFGFHSIAGILFNEEGTASNFAETFYGQVIGGKGWTAAHFDPVIAEKMKGATPEELNAFIYKRAFEKLREAPGKLINGIIKSYRNYITSIPYAINQHGVYPDAINKNGIYFFIALIVLFLFEGKEFLINVFEQFKKRRLVWGGTIGLFTVGMEYGLTLFLIIGLIIIVKDYKRKMNLALILYLAGILLSIPFVGADGGERVKISSDIFIFAVTCMGMNWVLWEKGIEVQVDTLNTYHVHRLPLWELCSVGFCVLFFFVIPSIAMSFGVPRQPVEKLPTIQEIYGNYTIDTDEKILSLDEWQSLGNWPDPTYEKVNNRLFYMQCFYKDEYAVYMAKNEGVASRLHELWPMRTTSPPISRTVLTLGWFVFPNTHSKKLQRFDGKQIYTFGRLITHARNWKYDTGFALLVSHIGYVDSNNKFRWISLENL